MDWLTTSTILERLRNFDDDEVWKQFSSRFRRPLEAFAGRFGLSAAETEDVVQETLLAFADAFRGGKYDPAAGRLSSWLFGIAYRQAANAVRQRARNHARFGEATPSQLARVSDEREARAAWDGDWERAALETSLMQARGELSEKTVRAFEMVVREGRSPDQAAAELGMSRDAVYVAKHRVLKRLGELMREFEE